MKLFYEISSLLTAVNYFRWKTPLWLLDMVPDTALISFGLYTPYYAVLSDQSDKDSATETKYEILFDEPFLGALQIR